MLFTYNIKVAIEGKYLGAHQILDLNQNMHNVVDYIHMCGYKKIVVFASYTRSNEIELPV